MPLTAMEERQPAHTSVHTALASSLVLAVLILMSRQLAWEEGRLELRISALGVEPLLLAAYLSAACYSDIRWRRIRNWLNLATLGLVLALSALGALSSPDLSDRALGSLLAFVVMFIGYAVGMFGAGDVKATAVLGAFWGLEHVFAGIAIALMAGGAIAVLLLLRGGLLLGTLRGLSQSALLSYSTRSLRSALPQPGGIEVSSGAAHVAPTAGGVPFACALAVAAIWTGVQHASG